MKILVYHENEYKEESSLLVAKMMCRMFENESLIMDAETGEILEKYDNGFLTYSVL